MISFIRNLMKPGDQHTLPDDVEDPAPEILNLETTTRKYEKASDFISISVGIDKLISMTIRSAQGNFNLIEATTSVDGIKLIIADLERAVRMAEAMDKPKENDVGP